MIEVLVVFATLAAYWFLVATKLPKRFPPGPRFTLPIIGNAHQLGDCLKTGIDDFTTKYGNVCGFSLGSNRAVVVSSYELLKELGSKAAFRDRLENKSAGMLVRGGLVKSGDKLTSPGIFLSNGPTWVEQRRYSMSKLRDLGFGKKSTESIIVEEVDDLCKYLEDQSRCQAIDVKFGFTAAVLNAYWTMLSSRKLTYNDATLVKLVGIVTRAFEEQGRPIWNYQVVNFYKPLMKLCMKMGIGLSHVMMLHLRDYTDKIVCEHEVAFQEDNLGDFIDHYLLQMKNTANASSSFYGKDGRLNLVNTLLDFFLAGIDSTSSTLRWGMLYMILNPDIQEKVQDELDKATGGGRLPTLDDKIRTPYTEAVVHELQRLADIAPLSITHCLSEDVELAGYHIPKGTAIMPNLSNVHKDPLTFPDPERFDPTRFLDEEGKFKPHPKVIPFGIGKRKCMGESLARMSLYLFFAGILSRFTVSEDETIGKPSTERVYGITAAPRPFKINFKPRK